MPIAPDEAARFPLVWLIIPADCRTAMLRNRDVVGVAGLRIRSVGGSRLWWMAQTRLSEGRILGDGRLSRACVDLWGITSGMGRCRVQFGGRPCLRLEAAGDAHSPLSDRESFGFGHA
jgi:hypothetical protein